MANPAQIFQQLAGFIAAGLSALAIDTLTLHLLTTYAGFSPFAARPIGIGLAMVVSWAINRRFAFAVTAPPSWAEFAKFAAASALAVAVNYLVFAAILLAYPAVNPILAVIVASMISMFVSYTGYRFGAFRAPQSKSPKAE
jgi:putative flippase GtrA